MKGKVTLSFFSDDELTTFRNGNYRFIFYVEKKIGFKGCEKRYRFDSKMFDHTFYYFQSF